MYENQEELIIKLFKIFYQEENKTCVPFTEKELLKRKIINKLDLEDFDDLFDEGLIDVCDMDEFIEGSKEIEYILSKEAIEYINSK